MSKNERMVVLENENSMVYEYGELSCRNCKFRGEGCKRINHKDVRFRISIFQGYDYTSYMGNICKDFSPSPSSKWLYENWTKLEDYYTVNDLTNGTVPFTVSGSKDVTYHVDARDFYFGTMYNKDGSLKWKYKIVSTKYFNKRMRKYSFKQVKIEGGVYYGTKQND